MSIPHIGILIFCFTVIYAMNFCVFFLKETICYIIHFSSFKFGLFCYIIYYLLFFVTEIRYTVGFCKLLLLHVGNV